MYRGIQPAGTAAVQLAYDIAIMRRALRESSRLCEKLDESGVFAGRFGFRFFCAVMVYDCQVKDTAYEEVEWGRR